MRLPVIDGDDNQIDVKAAEKCLHTAWNPALTIMIPHTVITVENPELVVGELLKNMTAVVFIWLPKFPGYDLTNMPKVKDF